MGERRTSTNKLFRREEEEEEDEEEEEEEETVSPRGSNCLLFSIQHKNRRRDEDGTFLNHSLILLLIWNGILGVSCRFSSWPSTEEPDSHYVNSILAKERQQKGNGRRETAKEKQQKRGSIRDACVETERLTLRCES